MTVIGVKVNVKGEGETICRATLLFVVADLPAKASLLNIIQLNLVALPATVKESK